jgi:hypothetical protein
MATQTALRNTLIQDGPAIFYDAGFRNVIEDHLEILKTKGQIQNVPIDPHDAYKFEYDFYALLAKHAVPAHMHWIVLRVNDMTTPTEFRSDRLTLLVPDSAQIEKIKSTHTTIHKIS